MKIQLGGPVRIALRVAAALCLLIGFVFVVGLLVVRTQWFKEKVRDGTIAVIEHATGGKAELRSFDFNWHTLTANFKGFTLHGTEPVTGPPLFHSESILISLRVISLLERNVDVSSVVVDRSGTYFLVRSDGSTNIPGPRHRLRQITGDLLKLKIGRFEFRDATVQTDLKQFLLNVRGEGLRLSLAYEAHPSRYDAVLSSASLSVDSPQLNAFSGKVKVSAELQPDQIAFKQIALESGHSVMHVRGMVRRFSDPVADAEFTSDLAAPDMAERFNIRGLSGGQIRVDGVVHYYSSTKGTFRGKASGENINFDSNGLRLSKAKVSFGAEGNRDQIRFSRIALSNPEISLNGSGTLTDANRLQLNGTVARLPLSSAVRQFRVSPIPYSGVLSGSFQLAGVLRKGLRDLQLSTDLHIIPGGGGVPLSGEIKASYSEKTGSLNFADSHVSTANSRLELAGSPGEVVRVRLSSTNLTDLLPAFELVAGKGVLKVVSNLSFTHAAFDGNLLGKLNNLTAAGDVSAEGLRIHGIAWDELHSHLSASSRQIAFTSLSARQDAFQLQGGGSVGLDNWAVRPESAVHLNATFRDAGLSQFSPAIRGTASGSLTLAGTVSVPSGHGQFAIDDLEFHGEHVERASFGVSLDSTILSFSDGRARDGSAAVSFSGSYKREGTNWKSGNAEMQVDSNSFPLATLSFARKLLPGAGARLQVHAKLRARIANAHIEPENADGTLNAANVTLDGAPLGDVTVNAATKGEQLTVGVAGNLEGSPLSGNLRAQLVDSDPATGELHFGRISLSTVYGFSRMSNIGIARPGGFVHGSASFDGPLLKPAQMSFRVRMDELQMNSPDGQISVHNTEPILVEARGGTAKIDNLHLGARDTHLSVSGSFGYGAGRTLDLRMEGSSDFRLLQILDPSVQSSGVSMLKVSITGTFDRPLVDGTVEIRGGSLFVKNFTNGLSNVNGTLRLNRDRATIQKLTAETGGGELGLTGFVSLGARRSLIYNLQATAAGVRVRYAGASVTANASLELTGSSENGLLSGRITVARVIIGQNADVATMLTSTVSSAPPPGNEKDLISGLLLDLRVQSSPNLRISTDLSQDVEADIDLRVRGTAVHPILLGSISANQGEIKVFGAKYSINRGDITFVNSVRIEPVLDLDLQTETRGITVDITISGTLNKLNMNYRSDPPLQPKDIIALLTVGQAPSVTANPSNIKADTDVSALQAGANTVLGQAISPASNRLSKLFGITNIKIDPLVQGITNTPQARLTLEQQISRDITVTYVTNLAQTSEQIFRFEWALNRQFSVVAVRDDNGEFGIDFQYKKRFR